LAKPRFPPKETQRQFTARPAEKELGKGGLGGAQSRGEHIPCSWTRALIHSPFFSCLPASFCPIWQQLIVQTRQTKRGRDEQRAGMAQVSSCCRCACNSCCSPRSLSLLLPGRVVIETAPLVQLLIPDRQTPPRRTGWLKACKLAGIESLRIHDLRHTFGTRAADAGVPLPAIRDVMGHKSTKTTERYTHATDAGKRRAVEAAERKPGKLVKIWSKVAGGRK